MYKVLLVDDERIITDGMSKVIKWDSIGTELTGTAKNGIQALEEIKKNKPDIIISDIKMPGMDGLELVAKVKDQHPEIRFMLLSGFSEFDYAKQAMEYGVKHYLLKPCNENTISEALVQICSDLDDKKEREGFIENLEQTLENVLPYVKEQMLKEFVTNIYETNDLEYYQSRFGLDLPDNEIRVLLFQLEGQYQFEQVIAIKNLAEHYLGDYLLSCFAGELCLILIKDELEFSRLLHIIDQIRDNFFDYYQLDCTIAVSDSGKMNDAKRCYKEALDCLNYRFYLGEGSIITKKDIYSPNGTDKVSFHYDDEKFCSLVKTGCWEDVREEISSFFHHFIHFRIENADTKSYVIQLFNAMIRLCDTKGMNTYLSKLPILLELDTVHNMKSFFEDIAKEITLSFYQQNKNKHSAIIHKVMEVVHQHIGDPQLSLQWVANEMLYMNADYLGKLFKKETGEKFSNYITRIRIDKAINLIEKETDVKVFEIAEKIGFGDNSQYFSQVFKKQTGYTPSEYKKESFLGM